MAESHRTRVLVCRHCEKDFIPRSSERRIFCSRECSFGYEKIHGRDWLPGWQARRDAERTPRTRDCIVCHAIFVANGAAKYCGDACRKRKACDDAIAYAKKNDKRDRKERACLECGAAFAPVYGDKKRKFCSSECLKSSCHRTHDVVRRAKRMGVEHERVDPIEICERDGWRCHLCKCRTPRRLRGTHHDRAPEVDHVVALAIGGAHTRANLACCCRRCNIKKGAAALGQLRLAV